jgi:hypothetical protein
MPFTSQVYKQIAKATITTANTEQSLYVVPALSAVVGQIYAVNNSTTLNRTLRVAVVSGGGTATAGDWLVYDVSLAPGESWQFTGATLNAADEVRIQSNASSVTAGTGVVVQIYGELNS